MFHIRLSHRRARTNKNAVFQAQYQTEMASRNAVKWLNSSNEFSFDHVLDFLKRNFYFSDTKSALVMTVRLIFSSLLKDFILLIFGHGDIRERVKNLPEILDEQKVVDSYIDKPGARMRKKKQAIREGI